MRIGISPTAESRDGVRELARRAEAGEIGCLWLGDGLLTNPDFPLWAGGMESMIELGWLAGAHPDIAIGITAAVLPNRSMVELTRQANTLAHLTDDRFVLAVAPGYWEHELRYVGHEPTDRGRLFRQRLAELLELLVDPELSPGPTAAGRVPVWLAGAAATMRHAITLGLPYQASRLLPDDLAPVARVWFDQGGTVLAHRVFVDAAERPFAGHAVQRNAVTGSPQQIVDQILAFRELGVADLSIAPGHDLESARLTIDVLAEHVVPALA